MQVSDRHVHRMGPDRRCVMFITRSRGALSVCEKPARDPVACVENEPKRCACSLGTRNFGAGQCLSHRSRRRVVRRTRFALKLKSLNSFRVLQRVLNRGHSAPYGAGPDFAIVWLERTRSQPNLRREIRPHARFDKDVRRAPGTEARRPRSHAVFGLFLFAPCSRGFGVEDQQGKESDEAQ